MSNQGSISVNNIKQTTRENKLNYQLWDSKVIQNQILQTNIVCILRQTLRRIINEIWKWKGLNVVSYIYFDNRAICKQQIKKKSVLDTGMRYVVIIVWKNWRKKKKRWQKEFALIWRAGPVAREELQILQNSWTLR